MLLLFIRLSLYEKLFDSRLADIYIFKIDVGGLFKRIDFSNSSFNFLRELMWTDTLKYSVLMVSQYNISLRVQFEDKMIGETLTSESKNNHSFHTYLSYCLHSLWPKRSPKFHRKSRWYSLFVWFLFCKMESDTILDDQLELLVRTSKFDNISSWVNIVNVGYS